MNAILSFVLKYVLDFAFGKLQGYFKKMEKRQETKAAVNKKVSRVKKAVSQAYDGEDITKEQRKEIVDSVKDLITTY